MSTKTKWTTLSARPTSRYSEVESSTLTRHSPNHDVKAAVEADLAAAEAVVAAAATVAAAAVETVAATVAVEIAAAMAAAVSEAAADVVAAAVAVAAVVAAAIVVAADDEATNLNFPGRPLWRRPFFVFVSRIRLKYVDASLGKYGSIWQFEGCGFNGEKL